MTNIVNVRIIKTLTSGITSFVLNPFLNVLLNQASFTKLFNLMHVSYPTHYVWVHAERQPNNNPLIQVTPK